MKGTIKRLFKDRGFEFIRAEDGREIFFHRTAIKDVNFESLMEGQFVEFDVERISQNSRTKGPRAANVHLRA